MTHSHCPGVLSGPNRTKWTGHTRLWQSTPSACSLTLKPQSPSHSVIRWPSCTHKALQVFYMWTGQI